MQIDYTGRNVTIDARLKKHADGKLKKLAKFLEEPVEIRVTFIAERRRFVTELHATYKLGVIQSKEASGTNLFEAFDLAIDKAEKQAHKAKSKLVDRRRKDRGHWPVDVVESDGADIEPRIIRSTRMPVKPMTVDEAALELESSTTGFVVFRDSVSDRISVLYRRKDKNFGLIAPEF